MPEEIKTEEPKIEDNKTPDNTTPKLSDTVDKPKDEPKDEDKLIDISDKKEEPPKKIDVEKPEGITDALWDKEKGTLITDKTLEELGKQTKMASDFRKKISKGLKADIPEKAEDYVFEFDKDLADLKIGEDDEGKKVLEGLKQVAHKSGIGQSQLKDFTNGYFKMLIETGIVKKPLTEAEAELENQKFKKEQREKLGDNPDQLISGAVNFIERNYKNGLLNESEKETLTKLVDSGASGVLLVNKIGKLTGEPEFPMSNIKIDGLPSDEEIAQKMKNNEYTETEKQKIFELREKAGKKDRISSEHF